MQKFTLFPFMMFPERFEPGNLTESTKQKYISKCEGLKPMQDLTMMNFDDLGKIADYKTFPSFFSVEKKYFFRVEKFSDFFW